MKKVAIGLSGGVDSAVSAALLKKQGYDVLGVYLYCYRQGRFPCSADEDRAMAVKVADCLHIPIKIMDLRSQYKRSVVDYFFSEYKAGRTPNPDVMCNKEIKFGIFYKEAIEKWGMDYVATGHYARVKNNSLAKGVDPNKDQSYFLYNLSHSQLEHILFPIGDINKDEVRKLAKRFKLPNADRPDSQGICFIGEVDIKKFLKLKVKSKKGLVVNSKGEEIGEHEGVWFYTIGQRHGFKVSYNPKLEPLYIMSKDSTQNILVVGSKDECYSKEIKLGDMFWIDGEPDFSKKYSVRIRHLGEIYDCILKKNKIVLDKPAFAVAPGQSVVIYNKDIVLGGGIIK